MASTTAAIELAEPDAFMALGFAEFFPPHAFAKRMKLRPLLTPDEGVYAPAIHDLLSSAERSVYMQTQYVHPSPDQALTGLIQALVDRQRAGLDVRLILSQWETADYLEQLQAAGLDLTGVRIQRGVHNKGIVVDSRIVLVSSQNWSGDGVARNRDAGLLIYDEEVAAYYERIFIHDWTNLAIQQALP
jgi:phosphatidylserine/phosphatidylglycerophosphate/cardiolipin synthase-like enzyme